jgi:hypothetical protein
VLSERFGCKVPDDLNPLVDDAHQCARPVGQIIDLMCTLIQEGSL